MNDTNTNAHPRRVPAWYAILILTLTCVVASALLAFVYRGTERKIVEQEKQAKLRAIRAVLPTFDNDPTSDVRTIISGGVSYEYYLGKWSNEITGVAFEGYEMGYGGQIGIMIGVKPDGKVTGIEILGYKETPGLGTKASRPAFRDQFKGISWEGLKLQQDGGRIEAITGATITSRAVTKGVREALERYLQNKNDICPEETSRYF